VLVSASSVTKDFPGPSGLVRALDGVSLALAAGEFAAVQGPSGCGKTTLLLTLGSLLRPSSGAILVDGLDPYHLAAEERARYRAGKVGFVFQQFHLVPYLSVLDNVLAPSLALPHADAPEHAQALLRRFGLADRAAHLPGALSTGERQRTALARALLNHPKLLLADEPTGNLDRDNAEVVLGHLAEFAREGGAVLLVTHDPQAAARANRVLRMEHGRLDLNPEARSPKSATPG
jgi:putative ABC transport system ATP-binding protein